MKDNKKLRRKVRNSYIVSTISVALVLFLLGSVGYLMVAAMQVADTLQQSVAVSVELRNNLSDEQRAKLEKQLATEEMVGSIIYSPKEEKIEDTEFRKMFGDQIEEVLHENPLRNSFELTLSRSSAEKEELKAFIARVEKMSGVTQVSYPAMVVERLHTTVGKIRLVLLLFGAALLIISLILLNNTIRLAIYSKRYIINTMKLVGATKWFIMKPFLMSSITQGVLAGVVASLMFLGAVYGLNETIPELLSIAAVEKIAIIIVAMAMGGVVISLLFTLFALNKFVNMKTNKIHLY